MVKKLMNTTTCLFEGHFKSELFTMKFHLLNHFCDDLEKFCGIQLLMLLFTNIFNVVLRRAYSKTSMRRVTRIQERTSAVKSIGAGQKEREKRL